MLTVAKEALKHQHLGELCKAVGFIYQMPENLFLGISPHLHPTAKALIGLYTTMRGHVRDEDQLNSDSDDKIVEAVEALFMEVAALKLHGTAGMAEVLNQCGAAQKGPENTTEQTLKSLASVITCSWAKVPAECIPGATRQTLRLQEVTPTVPEAAPAAPPAPAPVLALTLFAPEVPVAPAVPVAPEVAPTLALPAPQAPASPPALPAPDVKMEQPASQEEPLKAVSLETPKAVSLGGPLQEYAPQMAPDLAVQRPRIP